MEALRFGCITVHSSGGVICSVHSTNLPSSWQVSPSLKEHAAVMCDWRIALVGGTTPEGLSQQTWLLDTVTLDCKVHQTALASAMTGHSVTASGPLLVIFGGYRSAPGGESSTAAAKERLPQSTLYVSCPA
eukprot:9497784-Pyramimonas_sp.AAC.1